MILAILLCIILSGIFMAAWLKAKADISFLEGKALDFLDREKRWIQQIDNLEKQLVQNSFNPFRQADSKTMGSALHESDSWIPPEEPVSTDLYHVDSEHDLQQVELGNVTMAFLQKVGVKSIQTTQAEVVMLHEECDVEQIHFFEESDVNHKSSAPSLDKCGLHYWEGNILQKFSDDLALISNGTHMYHLSHNKLIQFQNGDNVCMQVLVGEAGINREVLMVWQPEEIAVSA
ncbi:hypothetical protein [Paenibacillus agricola]|uniref:Uncharacterized protein n=1 Tax=Paenibacillus agricola TaxID=2716264 RepID=A0ABX0JG53_9BACL|nr:hypothetical protein [Paenibacillus agricola]NHN33219.1 hypothetical protein [Paenibacillus agricola]